LVRGPLEVEGHAPLQVTGRVDGGLLRIWVPRSESKALLPAAVRAGIALAEHLRARSDLASRLASNLESEPVAGVRRRTLLMLVREFPGHEATRGALRAVRDDADAELRVRAGIALGAEGRDTLLAVAGGEGNDDAGARAVTALGESLTLEETTRLLEGADRAVRPQTFKACVGVLGTHGADATPLLGRVLRSGVFGEAAARALGATGDPSAEPPLLRALADGRRRSVGPPRRRSAASARETRSRDCARPRLTRSCARPRGRRSPRSARASRVRARVSCRWPRTGPAASRSPKTSPAS
jgi:hypothetical protein